MKTIEVQRIEVAPSDENFLQYPDFLVNALIKHGFGVIEATRPSSDTQHIDLFFTSRKTGESFVVARLGSGFFRPLLARLGLHFGSEEMLYGGHTLFACEAECEGQKRLRRFSLFVCNEPSMGIWMKLYFYCVDGVWPMRKEAK